MKLQHRRFAALVAMALGTSLGMSMILFIAWLGQPTMGSAAVVAGSAASPRSVVPNAPNLRTAPNLTTTPTPPCGSLPTWTPGAVGPRARYAIQGALANDGNPRFTPVPSFYIVGGLDAFNNPIADVTRYNSLQNSWSTVSSLPVAAGRVAVGGSSNYIYAAGGYLDPGGPNSVTSTLRIYNAMFGTWSFGVPAPSHVEAAAGTVLNGKFYVVGGDNYTDTLSTNYIYDIGSNTWSTGAPLLAPRKNTYAVAQNGLVYVFGGLDAAGQVSDSLFAYNPSSNSWTTLASPNTGGLGNYGGISSYGPGYLIAVDGGTSDNMPSAATHIYDINNNTWITGPSLITARMGMVQSTLNDGRTIVYGGLSSPGNVLNTTELLLSPCAPPTPTPIHCYPITCTPTPSLTWTMTPTPPCGPIATWTTGVPHSPARYAVQGALASDGNPRFTPVPYFYAVGGLDAFNNPLAEVARYSPTQNFWSTVSSLPVAAGRIAVGGSSVYIYAAGGYLGPNGPNSVTSTLRIYNTQFGTWSFGTPMPSRVEAAAGSVLNGKFYVIGGDNYTDTLSTNYVYDIGSNTWSAGAPLPAPRKNAYATAQNRLVYVFGGLDAAGQASDSLFAYNIDSNSWSTLASPSIGGLGNYGGISSYGPGYLIAVDGGTSNNTASGTTHIYDIANNTWIPGPSLTTARMGMAQGTLSDGRIIVYGGLSSPGNVLNTTELLFSPCAPGTATPTPTRTFTFTPTPTPTSPPCGLTWRRVNSSNPSSDNYLYRVAAISANDVWAVGYYSSGSYQPLTEHWDGTIWTVVPNPFVSDSGALTAVTALSANDVWAVGWRLVSNPSSHITLVEHWDGTQWSIVPSANVAGANINELYGVAAVAVNDVWAVGLATSTSDNRTLIEHWDGSQWSVAPSPNIETSDYFHDVAAVSANDVWAVGESGLYPNVHTLAVHWNGSDWSIVSTPNPSTFSSFTSVATVRGVPNMVWAAGYTVPNGNYMDMIERWNGTQWSIVPNTPAGFLNGVTAISVNDAWAVGYTYNGGNFPHALHWDGSAWSTVFVPAYSNSEAFYGVGGVSPSDVWAVGNDNFTYPNRHTLIQHYNDPCITRTATPTPSPTPTCPPVRIVVGQSQPSTPMLVHSSKQATHRFMSSGKEITQNSKLKTQNLPDAPITFALDDGTHETSIGFGANNTETAALWLNRFTPPANAYPIAINGIQIMWPDQSGTGDNLPGKTARLVVYQDTDGDGNPSNATLLGQANVIIANTEVFENYSVNIAAPGPSGDIYIGFEDLWAEAGYTPRMFPASQDTTASQARSWIAAMGSGAPPNINDLGNNDQLGTIDSFGLPGNWTIRATGNTQASGCPPTRTPTHTPTPTPTCPPVRLVVGQSQPATPRLIHANRQATGNFGPAKGPGAHKHGVPGKANIFNPDSPISFVLDDGAEETSIGFGANNTESAALWLNRFTPPSNSYPIAINGIQILWPDQSGTGDNLPGKTARLMVYQDTDGDGNPSNATLLQQLSVTIGVTETFENYPVNITVPGPTGDLYIGFEDMWAEQGHTPRMFPAAQDTTTSQARSWMAGMGSGAPPDINNLGNNDVLGTIDSFGLPGNWLIRATGNTQAGGCPSTRTPTPTPVPALIGHVVWQGPPIQPDPRQQLPITLTLKLGNNETDYPVQTTDSNGYFAVSLFGLPTGTYNWRAKGPKYLANSGTVQINGLKVEGYKLKAVLPRLSTFNLQPSTLVEMGLMRGGDASNDNAVSSPDFNIVKATFGKSQGDPGYDPRADFTNDNAVNLPDFNVLKINFGQGGAPPISPGGR